MMATEQEILEYTELRVKEIDELVSLTADIVEQNYACYQSEIDRLKRSRDVYQFLVGFMGLMILIVTEVV